MANKTEKPKLTYFFILICIIVFVVESYFRYYYGEDFLNYIFSNYGFSLQNLLNGKVWVPLTSIFLHADPSHLIFNMIALYFFGKVVEQSLGRKKFLITFFASGFIADMFVIASDFIGFSSATVPTIGASAAIFGLMGIAMVTKPLELIFYPYLIPIPLVLVAFIYTLYNISTFLLVITGQTSSNVSYVSHIGGIISGLFMGFTEKSKKGFIIIIFIIALLLTTPFVIILINILENFNYINILSGFFK